MGGICWGEGCLVLAVLSHFKPWYSVLLWSFLFGCFSVYFFFLPFFSPPLEEKHNPSHSGVGFWASCTAKTPFGFWFRCLMPMCVDKQACFQHSSYLQCAEQSLGFCCHQGQNHKMLWTEENGWFSKVYFNLGIKSKHFWENQVMTPLGMASSYCFDKQRIWTSLSKWIMEGARGKELYSFLTSYSSSLDLQAEHDLAAPWFLHKTSVGREAEMLLFNFSMALPRKQTLFLLFSHYGHNVTTQIRNKQGFWTNRLRIRCLVFWVLSMKNCKGSKLFLRTREENWFWDCGTIYDFSLTGGVFANCWWDWEVALRDVHFSYACCRCICCA